MSHQKQKLLYLVNIDFPPVAGPGVWRVLALAKYAAHAGHRVHVFCADRATWHKRMDYSLLEQLPPEVQITRISSVYEEDILAKLDRWRQSDSSLKRLIGTRLHWWVRRLFPDEIFHWALKGAIAVVTQGLREKPDAIVTTGPPHLVHLTGYLLSLCRKKTKWMMDFRDPWIEDPTYGQVHTGPYQYRLMRSLERLFIRRATWVTAVTPGFLESVRSFVGTSRYNDKFKVITNGHDLPLENLLPSEEEQSSKQRLVIHFNGTIQEGNDVYAHLFRAITAYMDARANHDLPRVCFSFCGVTQKIQSLANDLGVAEYIHDHGALSQSESQKVSRAADVLLVTVKPDILSARGVVPAKLYEAIALGKPILALVPEPSDVRDILAGDPLSMCIMPFDEKAILDSLKTFARMATEGTLVLDTAGRESRLKLANRYGRKHLSGEILQLLGFTIPSVDVRSAGYE